MKGESKAFEEIKHQHNENPSRLQIKKCERCHFDIAEASLVEFIKDHTGQEKMTAKTLSGAVQNTTFQNLKVVRGSLDDCIGWITNWS